MARPNKIGCFNSTMVRLKVAVLRLMPRQRVFQFHYGTIKSPTTAACSTLIWTVSIPLWYD